MNNIVNLDEYKTRKRSKVSGWSGVLLYAMEMMSLQEKVKSIKGKLLDFKELERLDKKYRKNLARDDTYT